MYITRQTLLQAMNALWSREVRWRLLDPNVVMIDFGHPIDEGEVNHDKVAIRFHVAEKFSPLELQSAINSGITHEKLPDRLGGFPTDVQQNNFSLERWNWLTSQPAAALTRYGHHNPLQGGISISDEFRYTRGTLGGIVIDRNTGDPMILSNWHVLAAGWNANPIHKVYQPGRQDGGSVADAVGNFARDAMSRRIDAAVATLTKDARTHINRQFDLASEVVKGVASPAYGMKLIKSGATSGITYGTVDTIRSGPIKISYGRVERIIEPSFIITPLSEGQNVSDPGDSGSIWFEAETMRAVGLHFAGSNRPERAVAIEMPSVLNALGVDILL